MTVQCRVFSSVTHKWPFQDHLLSETIISPQSLVSWKTWIMNLQSIPVSLTNGFFKTIFCVKVMYWLKICLLRDLNNEHAESFWLSWALFYCCWWLISASQIFGGLWELGPAGHGYMVLMVGCKDLHGARINESPSCGNLEGFSFI